MEAMANAIRHFELVPGVEGVPRFDYDPIIYDDSEFDPVPFGSNNDFMQTILARFYTYQFYKGELDIDAIDGLERDINWFKGLGVVDEESALKYLCSDRKAIYAYNAIDEFTKGDTFHESDRLQTFINARKRIWPSLASSPKSSYLEYKPGENSVVGVDKDNYLSSIRHLSMSDRSSYEDHSESVYSLDGAELPPIDSTLRQIINRNKELMRDGVNFICAYSGGKDSNLVLLSLLHSMIELKNAGEVVPELLISTANTMIENPHVHSAKMRYLSKIKLFAEMHDLPITVRSNEAAVLNSYPVTVIGARKLPQYASKSRECSIDLKIDPNEAAARDFTNEMMAKNPDAKIAVALGSRPLESVSRSANMAAQNAAPDRLVADKRGRLTYFPIYALTDSEVWEGLSRFSSDTSLSNKRPKPFIGFEKDMSELSSLYADAGGECVVFQPNLPDSALEGEDPLASSSIDGGGGCGARTGCILCTVVSADKSAANMIDAGHTYLANLNKCRDYIKHIEFDWSLRRSLIRSIDEFGFTKIKPDTLGYEASSKLLAGLVTADRDEKLRAERQQRLIDMGEIPDTEANRQMAKAQFELVTPEVIVHIEYLWSRYAQAESDYSALKLYHDVYDGYHSEYFDDVDFNNRVEKSPQKETFYLRAEPNWVAPQNAEFSGLRDILLEAMNETAYTSLVEYGVTKYSDKERALMEQTGLKAKGTFKDHESVYGKKPFLKIHHEKGKYGFNRDKIIDLITHGKADTMQMHATPGSNSMKDLLVVGEVVAPTSRLKAIDLELYRRDFWRKSGLNGSTSYQDLVMSDKALTQEDYEHETSELRNEKLSNESQMLMAELTYIENEHGQIDLFSVDSDDCQNIIKNEQHISENKKANSNLRRLERIEKKRIDAESAANSGSNLKFDF